MFLYRLCSTLHKFNVSFALVGGYAVSLHGAPRGTLDIDFILKWTLKNLKQTESALKSLGLISRIPISTEEVYRFRMEYIKKRNLIAWNFYHPKKPHCIVDIIITENLRVKDKKIFKTKKGPIPVLNIKRLIEMKKKTKRKQDQIDVKALEEIR